MESDKRKVADISSVKLFHAFELEWMEVYDRFKLSQEPSTKIINKHWDNFIKRKNLGISWKMIYSKEVYEIVDEKKWAIAKIKYGF
jgi:hypothetical protein